MRPRRVAPTLLGSLLLAACGGEPPTPDDETDDQLVVAPAADDKGDQLDALTPPASPTAPALAAISWGSFTAPGPTDADSIRLRDILLNANKYSLTTYWSRRGFESQGTYIDFGQDDWFVDDEQRIRQPASVALALAVSLRLGIYDERVTGVSRQIALARALKLTRSLAYRHRANRSGGWGHDWQTPLWALYAGTAGWLLEAELGSTDAELVRKMVVSEGRRLVGYHVPYLVTETGSVPTPGDSKAEENAWNAQFLYLAVNMLPTHPQRRAWEYKAAELAVSAHARPWDRTSNTAIVGGRQVRRWLRGSNVEPSGVVINHGFLHPDYMATAAYAASAPLWYGLRRQPTPDTMFVGVAEMYRTLVDLPFVAGADVPGSERDVEAPGGTIYIDGRDDIYYPNRTDWGTGRRLNFVLFDVVARHFELDTLVAEKASGWERLHATRAYAQQGRSSDGRTYISDREDEYAGREEWVAVHAALAYLTKWTTAQGTYARSTAFMPVVIDNEDREFNVTGPWTTDDPADSLGDSNVYHAGGGASGSRRAQWRLTSPLPAGRYRVSAFWSAYPNHATDAPYKIVHRGGSTTVRVNQRTNGNRWNVLGTFDLDGTTSTGYVELWNRTSTGYVVADGVMFERL